MPHVRFPSTPAIVSSSPSAKEAGSYLRRINSCITQLKAQGPSRTCNESKEEEEEERIFIELMTLDRKL